MFEVLYFILQTNFKIVHLKTVTELKSQMAIQNRHAYTKLHFQGYKQWKVLMHNLRRSTVHKITSVGCSVQQSNVSVRNCTGVALALINGKGGSYSYQWIYRLNLLETQPRLNYVIIHIIILYFFIKNTISFLFISSF